MSELLAKLTETIKAGRRKEAVETTQATLDANTPPSDVLNALVTGMDDVGRRFKANEIFVPEVLIAARAMKESMALLEPFLVAAGIRPEFTAIVGTVQGDLHDIGKNLVAMMWKGANFDVVDLGTNVPPEKFVEAAREKNAQVVGLSGLLTTTMPAMKRAVEEFRQAALPGVKVVIGGAPITQEFADEIGATMHAPDPTTAIEKIQAHLAA
jgi:5-methyltetrahydrofolate--homocysteine methyltransferase